MRRLELEAAEAEREGRKELAGLVVKLASHLEAFLLLSVDQLPRQALELLPPRTDLVEEQRIRRRDRGRRRERLDEADALRREEARLDLDERVQAERLPAGPERHAQPASRGFAVPPPAPPGPRARVVDADAPLRRQDLPHGRVRVRLEGVERRVEGLDVAGGVEDGPHSQARFRFEKDHLGPVERDEAAEMVEERREDLLDVEGLGDREARGVNGVRRLPRAALGPEERGVLRGELRNLPGVPFEPRLRLPPRLDQVAEGPEDQQPRAQGRSGRP